VKAKRQVTYYAHIRGTRFQFQATADDPRRARRAVLEAAILEATREEDMPPLVSHKAAEAK